MYRWRDDECDSISYASCFISWNVGEVKEKVYEWEQIERLTQDKNSWRYPVGDLCPRMDNDGLD